LVDVPVNEAGVPTPPSADLESLEPQLRLLRSAADALESSAWADALAVTEQYDREFPSGQLHAEARSVEVRALCGLGKTDLALKVAQPLWAGDRNNPAVQRLGSSCVGQQLISTGHAGP
jgi:hypothetical protein